MGEERIRRRKDLIVLKHLGAENIWGGKTFGVGKDLVERKDLG